MLSGIVLVHDSKRPHGRDLRPDQLARTLSALVSMAVEGLLSDVALAGVALGAGLRAVADYAGCGIVKAGSQTEALERALRSAARPGAFVILAGTVPEDGFVDEIGLLLHENRLAGQVVLLRERSSGGSWFGLRRQQAVGIVALRERLLAAPPAFERLAALRPALEMKTRARRAA